MLHVPYKGLGPALVGLMAGQVQVVFDNLPSSAGFLASGKLRALAVASPKRIESMPDVPTYAEAGYPQLNTPSWFGLAAPAGTRSEEHTSELQSLMRISSAVFCLKKKNTH